MIEVKRKKRENSFEYFLFVDGKIQDEIAVFEFYTGDGERGFHLVADKPKENELITSLKFKDFPKQSLIELNGYFDWITENQVTIFNSADDKKLNARISLFFRNLGDEKEFSNFVIYYNQFSKLTSNKKLDVAFEIVDNTADVSVSFKKKISDNSIEEELLPYENDLRCCHEKATEFVALNSQENSITASFAFPEYIRISCEQYLLYFAQFLQDLGINATSNLKEEAGRVLFSVTPTDDFEALEKIREALAIYLSLPSNSLPNSTGDRTVDMVLSGARANAKHLESQLELAIAKLQFKDATLELKDATIEHHQLTIRRKDETIKELQEIVARGNIFEESLERVEINGEVVDESSLYRFSRTDDIEIEATPVSDEEAEETKVGLVKFHEVTKLKEYGVSFDLAKAIRHLIDYFKRDKDSR